MGYVFFRIKTVNSLSTLMIGRPKGLQNQIRDKWAGASVIADMTQGFYDV